MASYLSDHHPDTLGFVEIDTGSIRAHSKDETAFFAEALGFEHVVKTNKYDSDDYWHRLLKNLPVFQYQDNAVLSRYDVETATFHTLSKGVKNIAIEVEFSEPNPHTVILVHLALFKGARMQQLNELTYIVNDADTPVIVCGDFNTFNPDELNILLESTRLHDAYSEADHAQKNTAPTWNPKHRLDNVLHTPRINLDRYRVLDADFSDHLPVMLDYSIESK